MNKVIGLAAGLTLLAVPFISFADSTVDTSAAQGTSISPDGAIVPTGDTQVFTIGVDNNYKLTNVTVDGTSEGAVGSVGITGIAMDSTVHTISTSAMFMGGGTLPYCSGPSAPGWHMGLPDGGCGGKDMIIVPAGTDGCAWYIFNGCVIVQ
jgi:hypothetical protein